MNAHLKMRGVVRKICEHIIRMDERKCARGGCRPLRCVRAHVITYKRLGNACEDAYRRKRDCCTIEEWKKRSAGVATGRCGRVGISQLDSQAPPLRTSQK